MSSLEMADMVTSVLDTVAAYRSVKLEEVSCDWWRAAHSAHVTSTLVSDWLRSPVAARASSTASGGRLSSCRRRRRGRWRAARGPPAAPSRPARTRAPRGRGQLRRRGSHGSAACRAPAVRRTSSRRISSSLSRLATVWNITSASVPAPAGLHVLPVQRGRAARPLRRRDPAEGRPRVRAVEGVAR